MNGGLASHRPQSLNNVCFASLTLASRSNINFGTVFKLGRRGDGPCSSSMNCVGVRTGNYDNFNWKQVLFREIIPKKYAKMIKVWHLVLRGNTLWTIWIERMTKCYNHEQWPESKVKQRIWD
jgi:hypothetical protein